VPANLSAASRMSVGLTMRERSKTARVLSPVSFTATRSGTPLLAKSRTAVRQKSCGSIFKRPGCSPPGRCRVEFTVYA